jgi:AraC-like DNA-binding protein
VDLAINHAPTLYRPRAPLARHIEVLGYWCSASDYRSRALPRGAVTVVIDVGPRQHLNFYAGDGRTRLTVPPAFITGPHSASYVSDITAGEPVVAIHFRPGGAFAFLGMPLGDLEDANVGVDEVWGRDGRVLHERLIEAPSVAARFALVEDFLLTRLSAELNPNVAAAMAAIEDDPSIRMAHAGEVAGLSTKRLIANFRTEIGLSPKAYARVRRFQAALRRLDSGTASGAGIAADTGHFDQAHFVREFRAFAGMTPTQYRNQRIVLPNHVPVGRQKYPIPPQAA